MLWDIHYNYGTTAGVFKQVIAMNLDINTSVTVLAICGSMLMPLSGVDVTAQSPHWLAITARAATADQANLPALSGYGNAYSDEIAELRMYRTSDRGLRFYNLSELSEQPLIFRSRDKDIIARILQAANLGPPVGQPSDCGPPEMDYQLHVVTLGAEGRLFGYFVVAPSEALRNAPPERVGNCASVIFSHGNIYSWHSYDLFAALRALGIL